MAGEVRIDPEPGNSLSCRLFVSFKFQCLNPEAAGYYVVSFLPLSHGSRPWPVTHKKSYQKQNTTSCFRVHGQNTSTHWHTLVQSQHTPRIYHIISVFLYFLFFYREVSCQTAHLEDSSFSLLPSLVPWWCGTARTRGRQGWVCHWSPSCTRLGAT